MLAIRMLLWSCHQLLAALSLCTFLVMGHGLLAIGNLPVDTLALLDWPVASVAHDASAENAKTALNMIISSNTVDDTSSIHVRAKAVEAAVREPLVATAISCLDDAPTEAAAKRSTAGSASAAGTSKRKLPLLLLLLPCFCNRVLPHCPDELLLGQQRIESDSGCTAALCW